MNDPRTTVQAAYSHKVYPTLDQNGGGEEIEPPPAYTPAQVPTTGMPQFGMMQPNMMQLQVQMTPAPVQWLTPGLSGGMGLLDSIQEVTLTLEMDFMAVLQNPNACVAKKFKVLNENNAMLFSMEEDLRQISSPSNFRSFNINAKDCNGQTVFSMSRGSRPCSYCAFCCVLCDACRADADVTENGQVIGMIRQRCSFNTPVYQLLDGGETKVMDIQGSTACCTPANSFELTKCADDGKGNIQKIGIGFIANQYSVRFPPNADARLKACCIGLAVLFNFRFHSNMGGGGRRRRRR